MFSAFSPFLPPRLKRTQLPERVVSAQHDYHAVFKLDPDVPTPPEQGLVSLLSFSEGSRTKPYEDDRVRLVVQMKLKDVRDLLWQTEGADSPEEFEKVWRGILRGKFESERNVFVHFGDFRTEAKKEEA